MWLNALLGLTGLTGGYLLGPVCGGVLGKSLSRNAHDRHHEAVTTGLFVPGPVGALVGLLAGCLVPFAWR